MSVREGKGRLKKFFFVYFLFTVDASGSLRMMTLLWHNQIPMYTTQGVGTNISNGNIVKIHEKHA